MSKIVAENKVWADVLSIGDELTSGQRLDTNSQWLSQQLSDLGISVQAHQTIGDYLEPMIQAMRVAADRAEVVVVSGGLGPTQDDLTRSALAAAFGVDLEFDEASWQEIQDRFARRQLATPASNRLQAFFPQGSRPIPNPHGTAPGIYWRVRTAGSSPREVHFFCLPGVPSEMREMHLAFVQPMLRDIFAGRTQVLRRHVIKSFGAGESHVESLLPDLIKRGNDPQVGITASQATISLRLQTSAESAAAADEKLRPVIQTIHQCLGTLVYGQGDDELEDVVVDLLQQQSNHLVVVEWGTRGLVSQRLDEAYARRGSRGRVESRRYLGSVILTHLDAAARWLAPDVVVPSETTTQDPALVGWLAEVAAARFQTEWVLVGGPLPEPAEGDDPAAQFQVLLRDGRGPEPREHRQEFTVLGHPDLWRPRAAKQMLNHVRKLWLDGQFG